jgi:hypothetical protein
MLGWAWGHEREGRQQKAVLKDTKYIMKARKFSYVAKIRSFHANGFWQT